MILDGILGTVIGVSNDMVFLRYYFKHAGMP
jgi:hypothetical protein